MAKRYRHPASFVWGMLLSAVIYTLLAGLTVGMASP
jgi:hypothetical protein